MLFCSGVAGGCLLLLHRSLLSCALRAGALTLVLALPMPRGLLEHKPTVPGPQEEVDKAEELQRHGRGRREVVRIGRKALWNREEGCLHEVEGGRHRGLERLKDRGARFRAITH